MIISPQYILAGDFSEGLAAVVVKVKDDACIGFINKQGQMVIPPKLRIESK